MLLSTFLLDVGGQPATEPPVFHVCIGVGIGEQQLGLPLPPTQNERLVASVSAVHSHALLGADKLAGLFHVAAVSQHGYSLGLRAIASPTDDVSTDLEEIQVDASPFMRPFFKVIM
jgi:hypothetical protein